MNLARICAVLLISIPVIHAQASGDWAGLGKGPGISPGAEVRVRTTDNKVHRGRFQSVKR